MMTTTTVISVVNAWKRRLLLDKMALTSFRRAEAICNLRWAGARALSGDKPIRFLVTLIAHNETASVDFTSLCRLHKLVIILLVLLVNGRLNLRCQLRVEVIEGRVGILARLCLWLRWLLLNYHRVYCLIRRSSLVCSRRRHLAQHLLIVLVENVLSLSTCLGMTLLWLSLKSADFFGLVLEDHL